MVSVKYIQVSASQGLKCFGCNSRRYFKKDNCVSISMLKYLQLLIKIYITSKNV